MSASPDPSPPGPSKPLLRPWLLLVCVVVAVQATYSQTLGAPFVWDDHNLVVKSPEVQGNAALLSHFRAGFWMRDALVSEGRHYYRPLTIVSLVLDHRIHGDNPGGFHLTNVLIHLINTSLLFWLLRRRGARAPAAALGSAVWALFPRLSEDVAWVSGRTDALAALFVLLALHAALTRGAWARVATGLAIFLGLLAKEVALAGAAAIVAHALFGQYGVPLSKRLKQTLPVAVALAGYAVLRLRAVGGSFQQRLVLSIQERVLCAFEAAGRYVWMCLDGWQPDPQIGFLVGERSGRFVALGAVCLAAAVAAVAVLLLKRKRRAIVLPVVLGATSILLTLHLVPISVDVVAADRFLYLPLIALTVAVVPTLSIWLVRKRWLIWPLLGLAASYLAAVSVRIAEWSDEPRFWLAFYRQHPTQFARPAIELGNVFYRAGMFQEALVIYMIGGNAADNSGRLYRDFSQLVARDNAAMMLADLGRRRDALNVSREVNALADDIPKFAYTLALLEIQVVDLDAAQRDLKRCLTLYPEYPEALVASESMPRLLADKALLETPPADKDAEVLLARTNGEFGRPHDSLRHWWRAAEKYDLSPAEWDEAVWFALQFGEPEPTRLLFERYRAKRGAQLNPRLLNAYQERSERQVHLRDVFNAFQQGRRL